MSYGKRDPEKESPAPWALVFQLGSKKIGPGQWCLNAENKWKTHQDALGEEGAGQPRLCPLPLPPPSARAAPLSAAVHCGLSTSKIA